MKSSKYRNLLSKNSMDNLMSTKPYFNSLTPHLYKFFIKIKILTLLLHLSTFTKTTHFNNADKPSIKQIPTQSQKSNSTKISSNKKYKIWKLKTRNLKEFFKK